MPLLTGDGLIMATEVGAAVENAGTLLLEGPLVSTSILLNIVGEGGESIKVPLVALAWEPTLLWVNKNGERFITEDDAGPFNGGNAVAMQPGNTAFVLFDAATVQRIAQRGGLRGILSGMPRLRRNWVLCRTSTKSSYARRKQGG